jgi:SOS-response transcriptional repressor LexA
MRSQYIGVEFRLPAKIRKRGRWYAARLPEAHQKGSEIPINDAETQLRELLQRAGFPQGQWRREMNLGRPLGSTNPDVFFPGDDPADPGVCVYLDGLSEHIHGNPRTAARDRAIRDELRSRHYEVFEIPASELFDCDAMARHFFRLARVLMGKDRARTLRDDPSWFESGSTAHSTGKVIPFRRVQGDLASRYRTCVPLVSLKAAAGVFGEAAPVEFEEWVEPHTTRPLREGMFVAQVVGHSMEPKIPNEAYCVFQSPVVGSRTGRILLVEHRDIHDPETAGSYTVKVFDSSAVQGKEGTERVGSIRLHPLNKDYPVIELKDVPEDEVRIIAEWVETLTIE